MLGPLLVPGLPLRMPGAERWLDRPAPTLGQHNREVLTEVLGRTAEEVGRLEAAGVIGDRPAAL